MTEKEFENLKVGDKVWVYHGFLSEAFVVSKQDNWVEFKADSLLPIKFSYRYVGITKSQALESEIEIQKKYVDVAKTELGQKQATLSALKAELAKAKEEEESGWVIINEHIYKAFPSDCYRGFQKYPTKQEAYEALADFYKGKYEEALVKSGKARFVIRWQNRVCLATNIEMHDDQIYWCRDYDGFEFSAYKRDIFNTRQEAEAELERRKRNDQQRSNRYSS